MKKLSLAVAVLALLLAGCTDKRGYGSGDLTDFEEKAQERLGTSTTAAPSPDAAPPVTEPDNTPTTSKPTSTTAAKPEAQGYPIRIQSDSSNTQFEPRVAQIFTGTPITWTNTDSVPRSVEFSDGSYASGPIAPGASVTFVVSRAGEFNYSDGTRPYAVGTLRVMAR